MPVFWECFDFHSKGKLVVSEILSADKESIPLEKQAASVLVFLQQNAAVFLCSRDSHTIQDPRQPPENQTGVRRCLIVNRGVSKLELLHFQLS